MSWHLLNNQVTDWSNTLKPFLCILPQVFKRVRVMDSVCECWVIIWGLPSPHLTEMWPLSESHRDPVTPHTHTCSQIETSVWASVTFMLSSSVDFWFSVNPLRLSCQARCFPQGNRKTQGQRERGEGSRRRREMELSEQGAKKQQNSPNAREIKARMEINVDN